MAGVVYDHVTKQFGEVKAVNDLSLDVKDKEFLVLVGPSGCGKTTALRLLAGLEEVSAGEIKISDRVVNDVAPKDRDIAMVFQSYALYPHMSVYDNMAFGLRLRKTPKSEIDRRVKEAADILGIGALLVPQAQATLRRSAAARGAGACDCPRAQGLSHGRAAVQPGCQAARPDARGDLQASSTSRDDLHLRDARSDRSDDDGHAHRGDEGRSLAAARHAAAACTIFRRTCSSPVLSAARR